MSTPRTSIALYALSVRNLGTPVFPKRYFRNLQQDFGATCEILTVRHQGRAHKQRSRSFYFRDRVMPYYTGSLPEARALGANDLMYWQVMRRAVERGCRKIFDFGRSKVGTGPYHFKRNWGLSRDPSRINTIFVRGELPRVNPTNPKYRTFIALWRPCHFPSQMLLGPD